MLWSAVEFPCYSKFFITYVLLFRLSEDLFMFSLGYYCYLINTQSIKSNKRITEFPFIPVIYT